MDEDATWYGSRHRRRPHCVRWRPSSSTERGTAPPTFQPMSTVAKWSPISATDELVVYPMHWIDPVISFVRFLTFQQLRSELREWEPVTSEDVAKLISEAPSKSCQLDTAPTWLVKQCNGLLAPFIAVLFNTSLSTGCFPTKFKHAVVTPVRKKRQP